MSPGATFERIYLALKEQLGGGRFAPGEHLEPGQLSAELNASITPVRDALHRLVGERMVETPRGDGFRVPYLTEVGLRHLYAWNGSLLALALRAGAAGTTHVDRTPAAISSAENVESLFLRIAARSGNPEHIEAIARLNDRLRAVRRVESQALDEASEELVEMVHADRADERAMLRARVAAYHRRRIRASAAMVAALQPP